MVRTLVLTVFVLATSFPTTADEAREMRLLLARELFEVSGGETQIRGMMKVLSGSFLGAYKEFYSQVAEEAEFSSEADRQSFLDRFEQEYAIFSASFDLLEYIGFYAEAIDTLVPIYADLYTEPELRQIIHFLRSPVGQKMTTTQPAQLQQGTQALLQRFLPRMQAEIEAVLASERERLLTRAK